MWSVLPSPPHPKVHKAILVGWNTSKGHCLALPTQRHCPAGVTGGSHLEDSFHSGENHLYKWRLSDMTLPCIPREVRQPHLPRRQGQQQCLPIQLFPNLPARQLVKLELPPTLGTNPPGLVLPIHAPSTSPEKTPACLRRLPAARLAPAWASHSFP